MQTFYGRREQKKEKQIAVEGDEKNLSSPFIDSDSSLFINLYSHINTLSTSFVGTFEKQDKKFTSRVYSRIGR